MKVILRENVDKLGEAGTIVDVKPGYARNFLIPQKKAVAANDANMRAFEEERKAELRRAEKGKMEAEKLAAELSKVSVTAAVQVGEDDKIFGSVTNQNIADLLAAQGFEIDRKKIIISESIKALGVYEIPIKLHPEVEATIKLWVVRE